MSIAQKEIIVKPLCPVYIANRICGMGENMTLTGMEYFVTLARERRFTRAAEKLRTTRQWSAVNKLINTALRCVE